MFSFSYLCRFSIDVLLESLLLCFMFHVLNIFSFSLRLCFGLFLVSAHAQCEFSNLRYYKFFPCRNFQI